MTILVLNCGSSSIKYQVIKMSSQTECTLLVKGAVERIGLSEGFLKHQPADKPKVQITKNIPDHTCGINMILDALVSPEHGVLKCISEISAVGHRVAHGGEYFSDSALINKTVKQQIEACFELAPLHNPAHYKGILCIENVLPNTPQVAVFDTSFHQTIPAANYMYALPYKYYEQYRVRRYGFHGTSHKFVAQKACDMLGLDINNSKLITCHIGNGASITAIKNGESLDTSMGFTPVDGLMMGTRCGSIDPGALIYIAEKEGLNLDRLGDMINKESGMLGVSGVSSDMRDIHDAIEAGDERTRMALAMFVSRIKKFIGAYAAVMNGVDAIIFTGGIGENDYVVREHVCVDMEYLGVDFNREINDGVKSTDLILTNPGSKVTVASITTDEELVIASDTFRLTKKRSE